jgi:uncharacterized protein (TIGR03067 family)
MIGLAFLVGFGLVAVIHAGDDKQDSAKKEAEKLAGTWLPEKAELAGEKFPDEIRKSMKLVLKDTNYKVTVGERVDEGTVQLRPDKKPKAMDITGTKGPNKDRTMLAIYELDGDLLKVCYALKGNTRPTEFKTQAGTQLFLVTYKRSK